MSPVPSVFPEDPAQMQVAAALLTPSPWKTIALPLVAAVLCLSLYLHRRRHPRDPGPNPQPVFIYEKHQTSPFLDDPPPLPPLQPPVKHISRQYNPWFISPFGSATAPLPLPTMRRHSCHMSQQPPPPPPTSTHYVRRTSADSIGPARSIRGSIIRGSPLAPGVRRNQWTIEIR